MAAADEGNPGDAGGGVLIGAVDHRIPPEDSNKPEILSNLFHSFFSIIALKWNMSNKEGGGFHAD